MNIETIIAEKVHALPITKQTKVLEFVEELENVDLMEQSDEKQNKSSRFSFIGIGERFSPVRAWRPAAGVRLAPTLGSAGKPCSAPAESAPVGVS